MAFPHVCLIAIGAIIVNADAREFLAKKVTYYEAWDAKEGSEEYASDETAEEGGYTDDEVANIPAMDDAGPQLGGESTEDDIPASSASSSFLEVQSEQGKVDPESDNALYGGVVEDRIPPFAEVQTAETEEAVTSDNSDSEETFSFSKTGKARDVRRKSNHDRADDAFGDRYSAESDSVVSDETSEESQSDNVVSDGNSEESGGYTDAEIAKDDVPGLDETAARVDKTAPQHGKESLPHERFSPALTKSLVQAETDYVDPESDAALYGGLAKVKAEGEAKADGEAESLVQVPSATHAVHYQSNTLGNADDSQTPEGATAGNFQVGSVVSNKSGEAPESSQFVKKEDAAQSDIVSKATNIPVPSDAVVQLQTEQHQETGITFESGLSTDL